MSEEALKSQKSLEERKNTHRRSGNQENEKEGSPERLGNEEEGERMAERLPKEV